MLGLCLVMLINYSGERVAINTNSIANLIDRGAYTRVTYTSGSGSTTDIKEEYAKVVSKVKEANANCKRGVID